ncbi:MAG: ATP-binding protein [Deltaproteobacteria bacterium]|nr:ATP-binding protein [Deltaproteobacteria bacterium]
MFNRIINPSKDNSFFIFGARGTGKSTWLEWKFESVPHLYIDLLNLDEEERLAKDPNALLAQVKGLDQKTRWIVIDEIQKLPKLLDVVHLCIEKHKKLFALTGSSARKLKRGAANLLAGRAFVYHLFPLTHVELGSEFLLPDILRWGSLAKIFQLSATQDKIRFLRTYAQTYLKEEIVAEQIIRKLDPFRLFLEIAAQQNGEIVNFSNIAHDVGVDTVTVQSYFQILEDTLIGFLLHPFHQSIRKRQRTNPKFYFFDLGVKRALEGSLTVDILKGTYGYGKTFEHFVMAEAYRLNAYHEKDYRFSYLRTKDDAEIDLIIERPGLPLVIVEIKSAERVDSRDIRTLSLFKKDMGKNVEAYCLSCDPIPKKIDDIHLLPWQIGLSEIGLS